jgi:hypothetical protein
MGPAGFVAGSRLARRRWLVIGMIVLAILGQAALATLAYALGARTPDQLRVFFQALVVAAKARSIHLGRDPETDPQVLAWRTEITRLRASGGTTVQS